jgi:hypothetical protein
MGGEKMKWAWTWSETFAIAGLVLGMGIVIAALVLAVERNITRQVIKKLHHEAVAHGAAEYVINEDGEPEFRWKEVKK